MNSTIIFEQLLETIQSEISAKAYHTWFKDTALHIENNNLFTLYVANEFAVDWVRNQYFILIKTTLERIADGEIELKIALMHSDAVKAF